VSQLREVHGDDRNRDTFFLARNALARAVPVNPSSRFKGLQGDSDDGSVLRRPGRADHLCRVRRMVLVLFSFLNPAFVHLQPAA
jgi:hypothetical protein